MQIRILPAAKADIVDGFQFYESLEPGLGTEFIESIFGDIDSLDNTGGIHPILFGKFRKLAARFPY